MNTTPSADATFLAGLEGLDSVGRYNITGKLGQGGNAVVYLGVDPYIGRHVALKISQPGSDNKRQQFFVEAQSAGRLNHPNIVSIYDAGIHGDYCYIAMECIKGVTLEKFCHPDALLPTSKAVEIIFAICNALDYAHNQKVIHRDIKPSNIMLDEDGAPKLTDFGVAQITEHTSETGLWGTPSYMSPEAIKEEALGNYSDIFSLGCVLYELLAGRQAFPGDNNFTIMYKITNNEPAPLNDVRDDIPPILDEIVHKAMAKDYTERYQSSLDFAYDLRVALRGLTENIVTGKAKDVLELVHNVPFFHNFSREQLGELVNDSTLIKVHKGKTIVAEGDIDDAFFVILSGKALIRKGDTDIATIGAGECFGEMACIAGQARVAAVLAETDCILMKINATLIDRSSEAIQLLFFKNFATTLVKRLSPKPKPKA
jgi:serine/threonine-protein kinase